MISVSFLTKFSTSSWKFNYERFRCFLYLVHLSTSIPTQKQQVVDRILHFNVIEIFVSIPSISSPVYAPPAI